MNPLDNPWRHKRCNFYQTDGMDGTVVLLEPEIVTQTGNPSLSTIVNNILMLIHCAEWDTSEFWYRSDAQNMTKSPLPVRSAAAIAVDQQALTASDKNQALFAAEGINCGWEICTMNGF